MKKKEKSVNGKIKFDATTMAEAIKIVREQNLRKVAHRPSGKLTWVHMVDLPSHTRDAIRDYLTHYPDMSIHHLAQLALEKFLEVPSDERIPYVLKVSKK